MLKKQELSEKIEKDLNRRLDSLSKLLACGSGSTCVAVSIINGRLIVASNDFFSGTKSEKGKNKKLDNIRGILDYFRRIIEEKDKIIPEDRKNVFKLICNSEKSSIAEDSYLAKLGDTHFNMVILDVLENKPVSIKDYRKRFGKSRKVAWDAYGHFNDLLIKFMKVEEWLTKGAFPLKISPFSEETILMQEWEKGVHAEMQILSELVQQIENSEYKQTEDSYIGISKLCCHHCSIALEATKEVFSSFQLGKVNYRGAHALEFDENWKLPIKFLTKKRFESEWEADENTKWTDRGKLFNALSEKFEKFMEDIDKKKSKKSKKKSKEEIEENEGYIYQSGTPSPSIGNSPLSMGVEVYENSLVQILFSLRKNLDEESELEKTKIDKTLQIMLNLITIKAFSRLFEVPIEDPKDIFFSILEKLKQTFPTPTTNELIEILKNEKIVGKKIAKSFLDKNLEAQLTSMQTSLGEEGTKASDNQTSFQNKDLKKISKIFTEAKEFWKSRGFKYDEDLQLAIIASLEESEDFKLQKKYLNALNYGNIKDVSHDGFCLFHAVADQVREKNIKISSIQESGTVTTRDIIDCIEMFLQDNWQKYEVFLTGNSEDEKYAHFLDQLEKYLKLGNYDQNIGDLMPKMLSDALGVSIVIHDAKSQKEQSFNVEQKQLIRLGRVNNNHYMVIDNRERYDNHIF